MKKLYTLMLAAAATVSASAAAREFTPVEKTADNFKVALNELVAPAASSFRAPSMAAASAAPASLEGKSALFNLSIIEDDDEGVEQTYNFATTVTFSNEEVEDGIAYYTMTNFLTGIYNSSVSVPDLEVAYFPEEGALVLFGEQTYATFPLTDGTTAECQLWAATAAGNCVNANYFFFYENGTFTIENPFDVNYSDGTSETFTADSFLLGRVNNNRLTYYVELGADLNLNMLDGTGNMTYTMTNQTGPVSYSEAVGAGLAGDVLTVYNFAGFGDVPMTIDAAAKTLTATSVEMTYWSTAAKSRAYLSAQNADGSNAAGTRKYVLASTYTVADGKTTVTVPNWNVFTYSFGVGDNAILWPMSDTKIVFDFDLDEAMAGVENIVADAEFDANAPVEYFNLQGMRVANPEAGQLLIKRQGNKATKVVIR